MSNSQNNLLMIDEICPEIYTWEVKIRVIRMWIHTGDNSSSYSGDVFFMDMVLIDSQGKKIQATIHRDLLSSLSFRIVEDEFYLIGDLNVVPNIGSDRVTDHPYKLIFNKASKIEVSEPEQYYAFGLSQKSASVIDEGKYPDHPLIDFVGVVTAVSTCRECIKPNGITKLTYLEISDHTGIVECVLFDDLAEVVLRYLTSHGRFSPIIVIQFASIFPVKGIFFGDSVIESVPNLTKVLFNPSFQEVDEFKKRLVQNKIDLHGQLLYRWSGSNSLSEREEFLLLNRRNSVGQLLSKGEAGIYIICARVTGVVEETPWWYSTDKPDVKPQGLSNVEISEWLNVINPKYCLTVRVNDGKNSCYLALFDEAVELMIGVPCHALLFNAGDPYSAEFPDVLKDIVGRQFLFKLERTKSYFTSLESCFKVLKVCCDRDVVLMYPEDHYFLDNHHLKEKSQRPISFFDYYFRSDRCGIQLGCAMKIDEETGLINDDGGEGCSNPTQTCRSGSSDQEFSLGNDSDDYD
ncbi:Nucleic acid-binding, OB-fold [Sesbania bispinosa]|nr:Nucleic acid-binding, OB-fold [Sesbania bispinosa]